MVLLPPGGRVVDVGCGTGADVASFPSSYDRHGLDQSATAIRLAEERHAGVRFSVARLPGDGAEVIGGADLVLLCDVLEHIGDDIGFLTWLVTVMKPGAHLLMTVPADPNLWSPHDEAYGHYRRYTPEVLARLWGGLPVEARLLAPFNRILYPAIRVVRAVTNRRGRRLGSVKEDLSLPWPPVNWLLERLFSLEVPAILRILNGTPSRVDGRGVSLFTVLRKTEAV